MEVERTKGSSEYEQGKMTGKENGLKGAQEPQNSFADTLEQAHNSLDRMMVIGEDPISEKHEKDLT